MYIIGTVDRIAAAAVPHALHTSPVRAAHTQAKQLHDPQIHILGIGNLGKFFAHSLAIKPSPPPLTLLLHRASLAKEWDDAGKCIDIITNGSSNKKHGFSIEILGDVLDPSVAPGGIIENVIVATKATHTASALALIKGRLNERSTVLFTQNGMGIIEEISETLFPDAATRPTYLVGIVSHGLYSQGTFISVHAGRGACIIGALPASSFPSSPPITPIPAPSPSLYLISEALSAPALAATHVPPSELIQARLEKLILNAMINPLTVIFARRNGDLFGHAPIRHLMTRLLAEAAATVAALPELRDIPGARERFAPAALERRVLAVAEATAMNTSSMLQDVRAGRGTEIEFINGFVVRRAEALGVHCGLNRALVEMVKAGQVIGEGDINDCFPVS